MLLEWAQVTLQLHSDCVGHSETQHPEGCSGTAAKLSVPNVRSRLTARSDFGMWILIFLESLYNISQTVQNAACSLQGLHTPQKPQGNFRRPGYTLEKISQGQVDKGLTRNGVHVAKPGRMRGSTVSPNPVRH